MSKITCTMYEMMDENDEGHDVSAVVVTCSKCGHETTSWGTEEPSVNRCLALMNAECPRGENNFYIAGGNG